MNHMTKKINGFTVIELVIISAITILVGVFVFIQKNDIQKTSDDKYRKTAINAMYYSLEKVFYPANGYYPQSIDETNLKSVDPDLFTDPNGLKINQTGSDYTYQPINCQNEKCRGYKLKTILLNEADYIKNNPKKD